MVERRFLNTKELSEYLGISINTIRSWIWTRQIPYHKLGRLVKFDLRKIETWLKEREVKPYNNA